MFKLDGILTRVSIFFAEVLSDVGCSNRYKRNLSYNFLRDDVILQPTDLELETKDRRKPVYAKPFAYLPSLVSVLRPNHEIISHIRVRLYHICYRYNHLH